MNDEDEKLKQVKSATEKAEPKEERRPEEDEPGAQPSSRKNEGGEDAADEFVDQARKQ